MTTRIRGLLAIRMFVLCGFFLLHSLVLCAATFEISADLFGRSFTQSNMGDVLNVCGYRNIDCSSSPIGSGCAITDQVGLDVRYPDLSLAASYRWNKRLGLSGIYGFNRFTEVSYGYWNAVDPIEDGLTLGTRVHTLDVLADFHLFPYPRDKKIGFDIIASGGLSFIRLKESVDAHVPDANGETYQQQDASVSGGLNALFNMQLRLYLRKEFFVVPFKLHWTLPVLRPSFVETDFDSSTQHRFLLGRNYTFKGLWVTIGGGVAF